MISSRCPEPVIVKDMSVPADDNKNKNLTFQVGTAGEG
jgi:hypothetical protein